MAEKNGQPSMEEILASIRRIIADEPQSSSPLIDLRNPARHQSLLEVVDDHSDFELPAIFRPSSQPVPEKPSPLFGRLTDAIRSASGVAVSEVRTLRSADSPVQAAQADVATVAAQPWPAPESVPASALSSLKIARSEHRVGAVPEFPVPEAQPLAIAPQPELQPEPEAQPGWWAPRPQVTPIASEPVNRTMVPFCDTRMVRMGGMSSYHPPAEQAPYQPPVGEAHPAPPVDFAAIVPGEAEAALPSTSLPPAYVTEAHARPGAEPKVPPHDAVYAEMPAYDVAAAPEGTHSAAPPGPVMGSIEDATADLLRPMLRQWLAENMPRMVEKALHIEVAESVKLGRNRPQS